jgi:hypothetical protein
VFREGPAEPLSASRDDGHPTVEVEEGMLTLAFFCGCIHMHS